MKLWGKQLTSCVHAAEATKQGAAQGNHGAPFTLHDILMNQSYGIEEHEKVETRKSQKFDHFILNFRFLFFLGTHETIVRKKQQRCTKTHLWH
jgi:hypothetical protein